MGIQIDKTEHPTSSFERRRKERLESVLQNSTFEGRSPKFVFLTSGISFPDTPSTSGVETFHAEVGCSGVLFNDPYGIPVVTLDEQAKLEVTNLIERIRKEQSDSYLAFGEVMLAYLKVLLILAARLKSPKPGVCVPGANDLRHPMLVQLRD